MSDRPEDQETVPDLVSAMLEDESGTIAEDLAKAVHETVKGQVGRHIDEWVRTTRDIDDRVHKVFESEMAPFERKLADDLRRPIDRIEREYTPLSEFRSNLDRLRDSLMRMVEKEVQSLLAGPELKNLVDDRATEQILRETERVATKLSDRLEERLAEALAARPSQKELEALFDRLASGLRTEIGQYVAGHTTSAIQKVLKKEQIVGREYLLAEFRTTLADAIASHTTTDIFREGVEKILQSPFAIAREERLAQSIQDAYREELRAQRNALVSEIQTGLQGDKAGREEIARAFEKRAADIIARLAAAEEKLGHLSETAARAAMDEVRKSLAEDRAAMEAIRREGVSTAEKLESTRNAVLPRLDEIQRVLSENRAAVDAVRRDGVSLGEKFESAQNSFIPRLEELQRSASEDRAARETLRKEHMGLAESVEKIRAQSTPRAEFDQFAREIRGKFITEEALEGRLSRFVEQIQPHFARLEASLSQCIQSGELELRLKKINTDVRQAVQQWEDHLSSNYLRKEVVDARMEAINSVIEGMKTQFAQLEEELRHYAKEASVDELFRVTLHEWRQELAEKVSEILHNTKLDLLPNDITRLKKDLEEKAQASLTEIQRRFDSEVAFVRERIKLIEGKIEHEISRPEAERLIETVRREIHSDFTEMIVKRVQDMQGSFTKELQERLIELSRAQESMVKRIPQIAESVLKESSVQEQLDALKKAMSDGLEKKVGETALQHALSTSLQRIQMELGSQIQRAIREAEMVQRTEALQQTRRLVQESESDIRRMIQEALINYRMENSTESRQMTQQIQADVAEKIRAQIAESIQTRPTFREIEERLFRSTAETRELVLHIQEEVKELAGMISDLVGGSASRRMAPPMRRPFRALPGRSPESRPPGGTGGGGSGPRTPPKERRPGW